MFLVPLLQFYKTCVSAESFPKLTTHAAKIFSLFGNTYLCEQMFSRMKHTKSTIRSTITDSHLEQCLRLATTDIEADIDLLVKSKQHHHSH